jgi:ParB family chromosome partitioning protein
MRLLALPDEVLAMLREGALSAGHARTLIGLPDAAARARLIAGRGMSVRQAEALSAPGKDKRAAGSGRKAARDADIAALEARLGEALGLRVAIAHGRGGGSITIHYRDLDQSDMVLARLDTQA